MLLHIIKMLLVDYDLNGDLHLKTKGFKILVETIRKISRRFHLEHFWAIRPRANFGPKMIAIESLPRMPPPPGSTTTTVSTRRQRRSCPTPKQIPGNGVTVIPGCQSVITTEATLRRRRAQQPTAPPPPPRQTRPPAAATPASTITLTVSLNSIWV